MNLLCKVLLVSFVCFSFYSCKKGCTDCNATNFSSKAKKDDGSCTFLNEDKVGFYSVTDTLVDWSQTEWSSTYAIQIKHGSCDQDNLVISNYSGLLNQLTGNPLEVTAKIIGDSIAIIAQDIEADGIEGESFGDFSIFESGGYFSGDTIYFKMSYTGSGGDANYGWVHGFKN